MFLTAFSAFGLIGAEKEKPAKRKAATQKSVPATDPVVIETILGAVTGIGLDKKTLTVRARYEMEYYIAGEDVGTREFIAGEEDVTFDIAKAKLVGFSGIRDIHQGSHVRIGYDRKGETLVAHTVLRIPWKQDDDLVVRTFLGTVTAVDEAKKFLTVKTALEGEFYTIQEGGMNLKEYVLEQKEVTFDTSKTLFVGNKKIAAGDTVRVSFRERDGVYIARYLLKIEKR